MSENKKSPFILSGKSMIYKMALTAVLTAMAVVVKSVIPLSIPLFGADGMKVGIPGIFTAFPALLIGPVWGGVSSALCDVLSYLVRPDGGYQPLFTLTAFLGGVVKGLVFWLLVKYAKVFKKAWVKVIAALLIVAIGGFGVAAHIGITGDRVTKGIIARESEVGCITRAHSRGDSIFSELVFKLTRVTTLSLSDITSDEEAIYLPSGATAESESDRMFKATKTKAGIFKNCPNAKDVYIPDTYTKFDDATFDGAQNGIVIHTQNRAAIEFAQKNGIEYVEESFDSFGTRLAPETLTNGTYTFSDGSFAETYASTANYLTIGLEIFAFAALAVFVLGVILDKKTGRAAVSAGNILIAMTLGGLAVAIPNVFIKKYIVIPAWKAYPVTVLMIPSIIEELAVRAIQAYIIWILMSVLFKTVLKTAPKDAE